MSWPVEFDLVNNNCSCACSRTWCRGNLCAQLFAHVVDLINKRRVREAAIQTA